MNIFKGGDQGNTGLGDLPDLNGQGVSPADEYLQSMGAELNPEEALARKFKPKPAVETFSPEEELKANKQMAEVMDGLDDDSSTWVGMISHYKVGTITGTLDEEIADAMTAGDMDGANTLSEFKHNFIEQHQRAIENGDPNGLQNTLFQFAQTMPYMLKIAIPRSISHGAAYAAGKAGAKAIGDKAVGQAITRRSLSFAGRFMASEGGELVAKKGLKGLIGKVLAKAGTKYLASMAASDAVLTPLQLGGTAASGGTGAVPSVIAEAVQHIVLGGMFLWDVISISRALTKDEETGLVALKNEPTLVSPMGVSTSSILKQMQGSLYSEIAAKGPEYAKHLDPNVLRGGALLQSAIESVFNPIGIHGPVMTASGRALGKGFSKLLVRGAVEKGIKTRILLSGAKIAGGIASTAIVEATEEGSQAVAGKYYLSESLKNILENNPELATAAALNEEITALADSEAKDFVKAYVSETVAAIPVSLLFGVMGLPGYWAGAHRDVQVDRIEAGRKAAKERLETALAAREETQDSIDKTLELMTALNAQYEGKPYSKWTTEDLQFLEALGGKLEEEGGKVGDESSSLMGASIIEDVQRSVSQGQLFDFLKEAGYAEDDGGKELVITAVLQKAGLLTETDQMTEESADQFFAEFFKWRKEQGLPVAREEDLLRHILGENYEFAENQRKEAEKNAGTLRKAAIALEKSIKDGGFPPMAQIRELRELLKEAGQDETGSPAELVERSKQFLSTLIRGKQKEAREKKRRAADFKKADAELEKERVSKDEAEKAQKAYQKKLEQIKRQSVKEGWSELKKKEELEKAARKEIERQKKAEIAQFEAEQKAQEKAEKAEREQKISAERERAKKKQRDERVSSAKETVDRMMPNNRPQTAQAARQVIAASGGSLQGLSDAEIRTEVLGVSAWTATSKKKDVPDYAVEMIANPNLDGNPDGYNATLDYLIEAINKRPYEARIKSGKQVEMLLATDSGMDFLRAAYPDIMSRYEQDVGGGKLSADIYAEISKFHKTDGETQTEVAEKQIELGEEASRESLNNAINSVFDELSDEERDEVINLFMDLPLDDFSDAYKEQAAKILEITGNAERNILARTEAAEEEAKKKTPTQIAQSIGKRIGLALKRGVAEDYDPSTAIEGIESEEQSGAIFEAIGMATQKLDTENKVEFDEGGSLLKVKGGSTGDITPTTLHRSKDEKTFYLNIPGMYRAGDSDELAPDVTAVWVDLREKYVFEGADAEARRFKLPLVGLQISRRVNGEVNNFIVAVRAKDGETEFYPATNKESTRYRNRNHPFMGGVKKGENYLRAGRFSTEAGEYIYGTWDNTKNGRDQEQPEAYRRIEKRISGYLLGNAGMARLMAHAKKALGGGEREGQTTSAVISPLHNAINEVFVSKNKSLIRWLTEQQSENWLEDQMVGRLSEDQLKALSSIEEIKFKLEVETESSEIAALNRDMKAAKKELAKAEKAMDEFSKGESKEAKRQIRAWFRKFGEFKSIVREQLIEETFGGNRRDADSMELSIISRVGSGARERIAARLESQRPSREYNADLHRLFYGEQDTEGEFDRRIKTRKRTEATAREAIREQIRAAGLKGQEIRNVLNDRKSFSATFEWVPTKGNLGYYRLQKTGTKAGPIVELIMGEFFRQYGYAGQAIKDGTFDEVFDEFIDAYSQELITADQYRAIKAKTMKQASSSFFALSEREEASEALDQVGGELGARKTVTDEMLKIAKRADRPSAIRPWRVRRNKKTKKLELKEESQFSPRDSGIPSVAFQIAAIQASLDREQKKEAPNTEYVAELNALMTELQDEILDSEQTQEDLHEQANGYITAVKEQVVRDKVRHFLLSSILAQGLGETRSDSATSELLDAPAGSLDQTKPDRAFENAEKRQGALYGMNEEGDLVPNEDEVAAPEAGAVDGLEGEIAAEEELTPEQVLENLRNDQQTEQPVQKPTAEGQRIIDAALERERKAELERLKREDTVPSPFRPMTDEERQLLEEGREDRLKMEQKRKEAAKRIATEVPAVEQGVTPERTALEADKPISEKDRIAKLKRLRERFPQLRDRVYRGYVTGEILPAKEFDRVVQYEAEQLGMDYRRVEGGYMLSKRGQDRLYVSLTGDEIISDSGIRKGAQTEFKVNEIDLVTIANIGAGAGAVRHELVEWAFRRLLNDAERAVILKKFGSADAWASAMETFTGSRKHERVNVIMNKVANFFRRLLGMEARKVDEFVEETIMADHISELFTTGALADREIETTAQRAQGSHSVPKMQDLDKLGGTEFNSAWRAFKRFMADGGIEISVKDTDSRQRQAVLMSRKDMYFRRARNQMMKTSFGRDLMRKWTSPIWSGNFGMDSMMAELAKHDPSGVIADTMEALKTAETERVSQIKSGLMATVRGALPPDEAKQQFSVRLGKQTVKMRGDELASLIVHVNDPDILADLTAVDENGKSLGNKIAFRKGLRSDKSLASYEITAQDIEGLKGILPSEEVLLKKWGNLSVESRNVALPVLSELVSRDNNYTGLTEKTLGRFKNDFWAPKATLERSKSRAKAKDSITANPTWAHERRNKPRNETIIISDIYSMAVSHADSVSRLAGKGLETQNLYDLVAGNRTDTGGLLKNIPQESELHKKNQASTFADKMQRALSQEINPYAQGDEIVRHPIFRHLKQGQDIYRLTNVWTMAKMASSSHLIIPLLSNPASYAAALRTRKINNTTEGEFRLNAYQWSRGETAVSISAGDSATAASGRTTIGGQHTAASVARGIVGKADRLAMRTIFIAAAYDSLPVGMPKTLESLESVENKSEFWAGVRERANRMVMETQPTSEAYMRGDLQNRRTLFTTMLTRYSTQTNRMANMLYKSYVDYKDGSSPQAPEQFVKTAVSVLATNALLLSMIGAGKKGVQSMMQTLARGHEDDDELYEGEAKKVNLAKTLGSGVVSSLSGLVQGGDEALLVMNAAMGAASGKDYKVDYVIQKPIFMGEVKASFDAIKYTGRIARQIKAMRKAEEEGDRRAFMDAKRSLGYSVEKLYEDALQVVGVAGHLPLKLADNSYVKSKVRNAAYRSGALDSLYR